MPRSAAGGCGPDSDRRRVLSLWRMHYVNSKFRRRLVCADPAGRPPDLMPHGRHRPSFTAQRRSCSGRPCSWGLPLGWHASPLGAPSEYPHLLRHGDVIGVVRGPSTTTARMLRMNPVDRIPRLAKARRSEITVRRPAPWPPSAVLPAVRCARWAQRREVDTRPAHYEIHLDADSGGSCEIPVC